MAYAITVMGLRRDDFEWLTPAEFKCCIDEYNKKYEADERKQYELMRFQVWLEFGKENSEPVSICRFPWEPLKMGRIINGKTSTISKTKSTARRGK